MTHPTLELKTISLESLDSLVRTHAVCLSIYLPAYQQGAGAGRSDVLLRSLLDRAAERLTARGVSSVDAEDLLRPVRAFSREEAMQHGHSTGIAIFRSPNRFETFALHGPVEASVHVEARFHVLPVLEQLALPAEFWVVALSRKGVRWLHGTAAGLKPFALPPSVPATIEEFLALETPDHRRVNRSSAGPSSGGLKGVAFGTGHEAEVQNVHFRDYCLAIDRGLRAVIGPATPPVTLVGATAEVSIFRAVSQYRYLTDPILRSPDDGGLPNGGLEQAVRELLAKEPSARELIAESHIEKVMGTALCVDDLGTLLRFAAKGRVDVAFVSAGLAQLGDVDHATGKTRLSGEMPADDDDLYNAAALEVLAHSGEVWVVPAERVPGGTNVVARLRY